MQKNEFNTLLEQYFKFIKIPKSKQKHILEVLNLCKEIRDTSYPISNSNITKLDIVEFNCFKEKDMYTITGTLSLENIENRNFNAYIIENDKETKIYMDIERINVDDEPKLIKTSETITENEDSFLVATKYSDIERLKEKTYFYELAKSEKINNLQLEMSIN